MNVDQEYIDKIVHVPNFTKSSSSVEGGTTSDIDFRRATPLLTRFFFFLH